MRWTAYQNNATTVATNFTYQNLLDTQLVATSATNVYELYDAVRIKRIRAWVFQGNAGGAATATVVCPSGNAGLNGDTRTMSDTGIGFEPAFVEFVPDKRSAQGMWQSSNSTVAFRLTTTVPSSTTGAQTVLDLELEFRNVEELSPNAATAGVGLVTGQWYVRGVDGLPAASSAWLPAGYERVA